MKICIISSAAIEAFPDPNKYSGAEVVISNLAEELAKSKQKHQVHVVSAKGSTKAGLWEFIEDGTNEKLGTLEVRETVPASWDGAAELNHFLLYKDWLLQNFGDGQGVVLDSTWQMFSYLLVGGFKGIIFGAVLDIEPHPNMKLLHLHHGMPNANSRPPNVKHPRLLGLSKTHAAWLSQNMKTPARYMWNGIPIPNVTIEECSRDNKPELQHPIAGGDPFLLSLNRITDEKGIHDSINIAIENNMKIVVAGDDIKVRDQGYVSQIVEMCRNSGGLAIYYGSIDNHTKEQLLKRCVAVIGCPYATGPRAWIEGFGLWATESLAYYKPVLCTSNGGLMDIIEHGKHGFHALTPAELSRYVPRLSEIDGNVCRQRVIDEFSVEKMSARYEKMFEEIDKSNPSFNW